MDYNSIGLIVVALIPAVVLFFYIYRKDRAEKEPVTLLLALFFAGALITFPAAWLEELISYPINGLFSGFMQEMDGTLYLDTVPFYIYTFFNNFIGVALIEEGLKFIALYLITFRNKNFNSLFDGMIYAVIVSLGFAACENILYAFSYGWETVFIRAVTAVPGHMFFGVLMGYFYSFWNVFRKVRSLEDDAVKNRLIPASQKPIKTAKQIALALIAPIFVHGFYDFCLSTESNLFNYVFYAFLIALYVFCFSRVRKLSMSDVNYDALLMVVFMKRNKTFLEQLSGVINNPDVVNKMPSKSVDDIKKILNTYYVLTFDANPNEKTALEELLDASAE